MIYDFKDIKVTVKRKFNQNGKTILSGLVEMLIEELKEKENKNDTTNKNEPLRDIL